MVMMSSLPGQTTWLSISKASRIMKEASTSSLAIWWLMQILLDSQTASILFQFRCASQIHIPTTVLVEASSCLSTQLWLYTRCPCPLTLFPLMMLSQGCVWPWASHIGVKTLGWYIPSDTLDKYDPCYFKEQIVVHRFLSSNMYFMWQRIHDLILKCGISKQRL